jgi:hypothetical protein
MSDVLQKAGSRSTAVSDVQNMTLQAKAVHQEYDGVPGTFSP